MIRAEMCVFVPDLRDSLSVCLIENILKRHVHLLFITLDCLLNSYIVKEHGGYAPMPTIENKKYQTYINEKKK